MHIKKRTLPMYLVLNCLTLGIYGFIVASQMNKEIDALCKGDKQAPGMGYALAWLFSKVPFGNIYYNYRWYHQANRMKVNANRYGLVIKETGTDIFLMRTAIQVPLVVLTAAEFVCAMIVPIILGWLLILLNPVVGIIFLGLCLTIMVLFSNELTAGANLANYYIMKNLNRYADVYRNGATEFDPMAYEYYPSAAYQYPQFVPAMISGAAPVGGYATNDVAVDLGGESKTSSFEQDQFAPSATGTLTGIKGACAGYQFELISGEEIIVGKDARVASVVIDPSFKEISRKHVGICYDVTKDQYRVVDYSSNGTWANGNRLPSNQATYLNRGAELKLANDKNIFLLG